MRLSIGSLLLGSRRAGEVMANGAGQTFNGIDEYAYVADNGDLDIAEAITDFCFGGYIKTGSDITTGAYVFGKSVAGSMIGRYGFIISSGILKCIIQPSEDSITIDDNISFAINTEYHLLIRIDLTGKKIYFYIDNVLQNTGGLAFTGTFATMENKFEFILGGGNNSTGTTASLFFSGQLRDVRIYHKDVSSSVNQTAWMAGKKLGDEIAWWNLPTLTGYDGTDYDLTGVNL